ncbi:MAG TPA: hypothetical protein VKZ84_02755 [Bacteriovoracaceae bacterium]|nr:hypothetical protein [Bacteriovoracaceae bacterium]
MPHMIFTSLLFIGLSLPVHGKPPFDYVSPESNIDEHNDNIVKIKTKNNTYIRIFHNKKGQIEVAEGVNLNRGDIFVPGQGILPLSEIEKRMSLLGERTYGRWRLIKYQEFGWVYQLNVASPDQSLFHIVNAYSGQLIGSITRLAPLPIEGQVAKD